MISGTLNIKFFLENIDITDKVSKYTIYFAKKGANRCVINTHFTSNYSKLLSGTLLHVYFNNPVFDDKYYLMYEGSLDKKGLIRNDSIESTELVFRSTSFILDKSKYTKAQEVNGDVQIDLFASDLLFVNAGIKSYAPVTVTDTSDEDIKVLEQKIKSCEEEIQRRKDSTSYYDTAVVKTLKDAIEKHTAKIEEIKKQKEERKGKPLEKEMTNVKVIYNNPANIAESLVIGKEWETLKTKHPGAGYAKLVELVLESMTINTPYFKVLSESLRYLDQFKIYGQDHIKDILESIDAFKNSYMTNVTNPKVLTSYRDLLNLYLRIDFLRMMEYGIPSEIEGVPVSSLIFPDLDYTAPPIFNVIYPDEYDHYSLSYNYMNEPTRLRLNGPGIELGSGFFSGSGTVIPVFLAPSGELNFAPVAPYGMKDRNIQTYLKFTNEEKYRGVNANIMSGNMFDFAWGKAKCATNDKIASVYSANTLDDTKIENIINKQYQAMFRYITDNEFFKRRLAARGTGTVTVNYFDPSWMIGFPGIIITEENGPILVMFDAISFEGDASGSCRSTISVSKPRLTKEFGETLPMDYSVPEWYNPLFDRSRIGANIYKMFAHDKDISGYSIIDYTGNKARGGSYLTGIGTYTNHIEKAAEKLYNEYMNNGSIVPMSHRRRKFVEKDKYLKFLYRQGYEGTYREAKVLKALEISIEATYPKNQQDFKFLHCPFVYERGNGVLAWLGDTTTVLTKFPIAPNYKTLNEKEKEAIGTKYAPRYEVPVDIMDEDVAFSGYTTQTIGSNLTEDEWWMSDKKNGGGQYWKGKRMKKFAKVTDTYGEKGGICWPALDVVLGDQGKYIRPIHPVSGKRDVPHNGLDMVTSSGALYAVADGEIKSMGPNKGYGNEIVLLCYIGVDQYQFRYAHLSKFAEGIKAGTVVKMGKLIGYQGSTGISSGPHLHFEVIKNGVWQNPFSYLNLGVLQGNAFDVRYGGAPVIGPPAGVNSYVF